MTDNPRRARNVCQTCKLRKRACDKVLPACGFCASRRLRCRYDMPPFKNERRPKRHPGRHFTLLRSPSPPAFAHQTDCVMFDQLQDFGSQPAFRILSHSHFSMFSEPVEDSLSRLVQHCFQLTKLTYNHVIERYSETFHIWFPIVSSDSLREDASHYQEKEYAIPLDVSVLLLSMLLLTLPTIDSALRPSRATQEFLYRATKSAFSQAATSTDQSLRLIQAALLVALREYTCLRIKAAYISVMTCVGLTRVSENIVSYTSTTGHAQGGSNSPVQAVEQENLARGIAMLERLVLCEMPGSDLHPQTQYPDPVLLLPPDLNITEGLDSSSSIDQQVLTSAASSNYGARTGRFRRLEESISLLNRTLLALRHPISYNESKLGELSKLDIEIRRLLQLVMNELGERQTLIYAPIAIGIRTLFLIHGSVIEALENSHRGIDDQTRHTSWMGIDAASRMMIDIVQQHEKENAGVMPICCFYNLRAARIRLQERKNCITDQQLFPEIDSLLRAEQRYRAIWVF